MKYSRLLIPTVKESPADAEIPSHQLMIRAGLMRKLASGTYSYLPLGFKVLKKVMNIVREEMDRSGAQELLLPAVQPLDLWQQTGRDEDYGPTITKFEDRHGRMNVLAPTAEEVVTKVAADELSSYKQLPFNIYQISFKFRDEFRPRFGVLRSREFIMKDAYSFHADNESLDETYKIMYDTYCRIFKRCGLEYVIVEAESGEMGGSGSHQFTVPCDSGEDVIVYTEDGSYAANIEKAAVDPVVSKESPDEDAPEPQEVHTPKASTIDEVCKFLIADPKQLIKTLIFTVDDEMMIALVRGDHEVNQEKLNQLFAGKKVEMAEEQKIVELTGAAVGFAGPVGLLDKVDHLLIDHAVTCIPVGITGANKTDYHLKNVVPGRDFPLDGDNIQTADIRNAVEGDKHKGKKLLFKRGIEVGQVFKLGTKYSSKIGANFLDENGKQQTATMGCYGIGINRIVASAIENGHDENGIIWPINIAPFEVLITPVGNADEVDQTAEKIHQQLQEKGIEVLYDDRDERGGVKFKDADLLGIPVRVTVGKKSLAQGNIELKLRREAKRKNIPVNQAVEKVIQIVNELKQELTV